MKIIESLIPLYQFYISLKKPHFILPVNVKLFTCQLSYNIKQYIITSLSIL